MASLIPEILLYDRLVFPVPSDPDERQRWTRVGWDPDLLDQRLNELEGLVHSAPWTEDLRKQWSARFERLREIGVEVDGLAMNLTPSILAMSGWGDRVPPPIMIAAYQNAGHAMKDLAVIEGVDQKAAPANQADLRRLHRGTAALFERRLALPMVDDPRRTYEEAIKLAKKPDYQRARRALFEWEDRRVAAGWPSASAIRELEQLVDAHDDLVKTTFRKTVQHRVFHVVQFVSPPLVALATQNPLVALAAGGVFKLVEARFPSIARKPTDALDDPGAALAVATSFMFHRPSR